MPSQLASSCASKQVLVLATILLVMKVQSKERISLSKSESSCFDKVEEVIQVTEGRSTHIHCSLSLKDRAVWYIVVGSTLEIASSSELSQGVKSLYIHRAAAEWNNTIFCCAGQEGNRKVSGAPVQLIVHFDSCGNDNYELNPPDCRSLQNASVGLDFRHLFISDDKIKLEWIIGDFCCSHEFAIEEYGSLDVVNYTNNNYIHIQRSRLDHLLGFRIIPVSEIGGTEATSCSPRNDPCLSMYYSVTKSSSTVVINVNQSEPSVCLDVPDDCDNMDVIGHPNCSCIPCNAHCLANESEDNTTLCFNVTYSTTVTFLCQTHKCTDEENCNFIYDIYDSYKITQDEKMQPNMPALVVVYLVAGVTIVAIALYFGATFVSWGCYKIWDKNKKRARKSSKKEESAAEQKPQDITK